MKLLRYTGTDTAVLNFASIAVLLGPRLIRLRGDLGEKFTELEGDDGSSPIFDYIYHCNAQNPR